MLLIRQALRSASRPGRIALAYKATPSTWAYFSSSSNIASRDHDRHDLHGATTGPSTSAEVHEEESDAEFRRAEASSADLNPEAAPVSELRPESSGTKPLVRPHPGHEQQTQGWVQPQKTPRKKDYFRFVRIFNLSADTGLADILEGIAQTAPVGRVLHVHWEKDEVAVHRTRQAKTAFVLFDHHRAATYLVRLAKKRIFQVRGKTPHVSIWKTRPFHSNFTGKDASRVIHIRGPRDVEGFSVDGIRDLLLGNEKIVKAMGPLGLDAEAVVTKQLGGGKQLIEWRFLSNDKQARPILFLLRRLFYKSLLIDFGPDPCWNEELYPRVYKGTSQVPAIRQPFKWPSVRRHERTSGDEDTHHSLERNKTRPVLKPYQMPWENLQKDSAAVNYVLEKLFGRDEIPPTLGERQHERIAAWTQTSQLSNTDAQYGHEHDDHHKGKEMSSSQGEDRSPGWTEGKVPRDGWNSFEQEFKEAIEQEFKGAHFEEKEMPRSRALANSLTLPRGSILNGKKKRRRSTIMASRRL